MRVYELTYTIIPGLSEEEKKALFERVVSLLGTQPIQQESSSSLTTLAFYLEPQKLEDAEKGLKQEKLIQKHIIVKKVASRAKSNSSKRTNLFKQAQDAAKAEKKTDKPKVELKEIEKKLDELLKE
ncbi:MAG: hypothetical protein Q8P63_02145 [Candidatus Nealsonbacteria bacterium]|nr:hypothetical protein [Candidatus Nealsonbacteria bacterium]